MSLFLITLLNGVALAVRGACFLWSPAKFVEAIQAFPRSKRATYLLMGLGSAWFLYHVTQLGEADYGNFKSYLFAGFLAVALLSFYWVPDFLAVRGLCILLLLLAKVHLDAAFMQWDLPQRLVFVAYTYVLIFLALYLAVSPFRVRQFLRWAYRRIPRARAFGAALGGAGIVLLALAWSY